MAGYVGGFCRFAAALNYKEKQNIKLPPYEKISPVCFYPRFCFIMYPDEAAIQFIGKQRGPDLEFPGELP
jgi:hypothetical protein